MKLFADVMADRSYFAHFEAGVKCMPRRVLNLKYKISANENKYRHIIA